MIMRQVLKFPRLDPGHTSDEFVMNKTYFGRGWSDLNGIGLALRGRIMVMVRLGPGFWMM